MAIALKFSTTLRNQLADSLGGTWDLGTLKIYDTAPPASPQDTYTGNLIATIILPADAFSAAVLGVISKAGVWSDTVYASYTAAGFRMEDAATGKKIDGTAGIASDLPDLVLDNKVLIAGGTVTVTSFTFTQPE